LKSSSDSRTGDYASLYAPENREPRIEKQHRAQAVLFYFPALRSHCAKVVELFQCTHMQLSSAATAASSGAPPSPWDGRRAVGVAHPQCL